MSTRIKGFVVTLRQDTRDDDAEAVAAALEMVKGVVSVKPVEADVNDLMNREQVRAEMRGKILAVLHGS